MKKEILCSIFVLSLMVIVLGCKNPVSDKEIAVPISFAIPADFLVEIDIENVTGYKVRDLVKQYFQAGIRTVIWDGRNNEGKLVKKGIYVSVIQVKAGESVEAEKRIPFVLAY